MIWSVVPASASASDARKFSSLPSPTTSGRSAARADQPLRLALVHHRDRICTFESRHRSAHGSEQISAIQLMNQMRNDFGIGLGDEVIASAFQLSANRFVIFDDAVVHDGDFIA